MAYTTSVEHLRIKKIIVGGGTIAQCLSGVEEVWDGEILGFGLVAEPDQFGREVREWASCILLTHKIIPRDEIWELFLVNEGVLHVANDLFSSKDTRDGPDDPGAPKCFARWGGLKLFELLKEEIIPGIGIRCE